MLKSKVDVSETAISNIFSIVSDPDCVKMLQMISQHQETKIYQFGSRKRYYEKIGKLNKAHLIVKRSGDHRCSHKLTGLGSVVHEAILVFRRAADLRLDLIAIDNTAKNMSSEERQNLIETVISDAVIRNILLEKYQT